MSTASDELQRRAIDAAERIAATWTIGQVAVRTLHTTAWILARANRRAPPPANRADVALVEVTAAAASKDLARVQLAPSPLPLLEAVVEMVIAGRDRNAPHARAEDLWRELTASPARESAVWWDGRLRMRSRESPESAADELVDATALVGWRS